MRPRWPLILSAVLVAAWASIAPAALFDHSSYDEVLHHYVDADGAVDYTSIRENSLSALESYFERLAEADMAGWSSPERLAFWINAYNARVIYAVAQKPDMKKISEDFALFEQPFKVAGKMLTLQDIKHRILRGTINKDNGKGPIPGMSFEKADPRIYFGLVDGTVSSPKLPNFAYTAENVDATLQENAVAFINSPKTISIVGDHLEMSNLFKWYAADFKSVGGVQAYISSLLLPDSNTVKQLLETSYRKTTYSYDWTINDMTTKIPEATNVEPGPEEIPPDAFSKSNPDLSDTK